MEHPTQKIHSLGASTPSQVVVMPPRVRIGRRCDDKQQSRIQINRNGDQIESIQINCACGEQIVVNCLYTEPTQSEQD